MKPTVVLAGDSEAANCLEQAGVPVLRAADAEDAIRIASANDAATIVLDRQHCGGLELVAALSQLANEDGRRVVVIDHAEGESGDELTRALRRRSEIAVCRDSREVASAVGGRCQGVAHSMDQRASAVAPGGQSIREQSIAVLQPQVLPIVAAKGGVGKTTVAVNLAALLSATSPARTVLADLAFANSDVGVLLELPAGPGLAEVIGSSDRLADLPLHPATRLSVVTGLLRPDDSERVSPAQVAALLAALRKQYEIVVLDLGSDPSSQVLGHSVEQASAVILVSTLDAPALRDTRLFINVLKRMNVKVAERVRLVLNRARNDGTMDPGRAEQFLGIPAACVIPDDPRTVDAAAYSGIPLSLSRPNHLFTQALWQLAGSISPAFARPAAARSNGLWRRARS